MIMLARRGGQRVDRCRLSETNSHFAAASSFLPPTASSPICRERRFLAFSSASKAISARGGYRWQKMTKSRRFQVRVIVDLAGRANMKDQAFTAGGS
jgi:hypothetical protein